MTDPTVLAAALVTVIVAATAASVTVINAVTNAKKELLEASAKVLTKVDGNFETLKTELTAATARISVLTDRLTRTGVQNGTERK